jgi:hypothetical protein
MNVVLANVRAVANGHLAQQVRYARQGASATHINKPLRQDHRVRHAIAPESLCDWRVLDEDGTQC